MIAKTQYGRIKIIPAGVYNEWVEIDLLPLIKEAKSSVVKDGKLQKFVLVIRTGVAVTAYFDGVTIVEKP